MKKLLLSALVLTIALSGTTIFAQTSTPANVAATVAAALSVSQTTALNFDIIVASTNNPYVDPTGASHLNVNGTPTVGNYQIGGQSGAAVNVTMGGGSGTGLTTLAKAIGTGTADQLIAFTADLKHHATTQGSAVAISNPITLGGTTHELYLGGTLTNSATKEAGSYSSNATGHTGALGDLTIIVAYN